MTKLSKEDLNLLRTLADWRDTATDEFYDIEGWRESAEKRDQHADDPSRAWRKEPNMFFTHTSGLISLIHAKYPRLDPAPLQDVYSAVTAWHADHSAKNIPPQTILRDRLERAIMVLQAVEFEIDHRKRGLKAQASASAASNDVLREAASREFRSLADRFEAIAARFRGQTVNMYSRPAIIAEMQLQDEAGILLVDCARRGWLRVIRGLDTVIEWLDGKEPPQSSFLRAATLVRTPSNVFGELVGGNKVQVKNVGGKCEVISDPEGGLLPAMFPALFPPVRYFRAAIGTCGEEANEFRRLESLSCYERKMKACRILADILIAKQIEVDHLAASFPPSTLTTKETSMTDSTESHSVGETSRPISVAGQIKGLIVDIETWMNVSPAVSFGKYDPYLVRKATEREKLRGDAIQAGKSIVATLMKHGESQNARALLSILNSLEDNDEIQAGKDWRGAKIELQEAAIRLGQTDESMQAASTDNFAKSQPSPTNVVVLGPQGQIGTDMRDKVFISYSHKDQKFLDELLTHLKPLIREENINVWSDKMIQPGTKWFNEISGAIASAKIAVMLVTPHFLASDFIHEHELGPILKEAKEGGVHILWVMVRACAYQETPLKDYQALLIPDKPLAAMRTTKRDDAWVKICDVIKNTGKRP